MRGDGRYRVSAYNTATTSTNKIHDDAIARSLGFRGGLVPGVDVYAYLCHLPAERWGRPWLERGTLAARFALPVYDGEEVEVTAVESLTGALELTLRGPTGEVCATAAATLPRETPPPPAPGDWPSSEPPSDRPAATPEVLAAAELGCVEATFVAARAGEYLDAVREPLPLFREQRLAHPGWLVRFANDVLVANVRMGPWIHVESRTQLFGVVEDGERVRTAARVTGVHDRRGHQFVDLDVVQSTAGRPVARVAHAAIFRPRGA